MHKNGLVVSLKVNDEFCKEIQNEVYLPFNSTYEIYLKNKTGKYALLDVFTDDKTVITDLLLNPYQAFSLKRFYEHDNESGHSLKFIQLTDQIKQHRGTKSSDGTVRVRWKFGEKEYPTTRPYAPYPWWPQEPNPNPWKRYPYDQTVIWSTRNTGFYPFPRPMYSQGAGSGNSCDTGYGAGGEETFVDGTLDCLRSAELDSQCCVSSEPVSKPQTRFCRRVQKSTTACFNDKGVTTHGAPVSQEFTQISDKFEWEYPYNEITLCLWGADRALRKRVQCEMCGTMVNVKQGPYCPKCGTYLL